MSESTSNILQDLSTQLANVVEATAPSVVRVDDSSRLSASGIAWAEGLILATSHGVERDDDVWIKTHSGKRFPAVVAGRDGDTDLALLRVRATAGELPPIKRAAPEAARVGSIALALGRPGEAGMQATVGIISARQESQRDGRDEHILHTDAILYPGFSGGPLVLADGSVAGLLNRSFGRGAGVALGVPILENVAQSLLSHGSVKRGFLGISTQAVALPASLRASAGGQERGLLIAGVAPGSPAESGGLLLGDVLLSLDGTPTVDAEELRRRLRARAGGERVKLQVLRGGAAHVLEVALGSDE